MPHAARNSQSKITIKLKQVIAGNREQELLSRLGDVQLPESNLYLQSYPSLLKFFEQEAITADAVAQGAHMVYGWMPTTLTIDFEKLRNNAQLCEKIRNEGKISSADLQTLIEIINNSLVGVSKFLHFMQPTVFPIFDSIIYRYLQRCLLGKSDHFSSIHPLLDKPGFYLAYQEAVAKMAASDQGEKVIMHINSQLEHRYHYQVSPVRAIELAMFVHEKS